MDGLPVFGGFGGSPIKTIPRHKFRSIEYSILLGGLHYNIGTHYEVLYNTTIMSIITNVRYIQECCRHGV